MNVSEINGKQFKFGSAFARLKVDTAKQVWVVGLYSKDQGKGHASEVLSRINYFADQNKLDLYLVAKPFGPCRGLTPEQLISFYQRYGFVVIKQMRTVEMLRVHKTRENY